MKNLKLIFINKIGTTFKGEHMFEFLYSNKLDWEWPESWYGDIVNLKDNTNQFIPDEECVKLVGSLKTTDLDLNLVQDVGVFPIYASVEGIIALGWEKLGENIDDIPDDRLVFKFGEDKETVDAKLYTLDLILDYSELQKK